MSYQETIEYLFGLQKHGIKLGLGASAALMGLLGSPHKLFRSVHIAGTNGKGSTAAFVSSMLCEAGYRVGLYTSPHLVGFTERIRINGAPISEDKVIELAQKIREAYMRLTAAGGKGPIEPTFFEVTTAMAFTCFAEEGVDMAVIETGMGGRLDSTNVITPAVSVITNIDLEHTEFLGATLKQIAAEKAGIIKEKIPVVTGAVQSEAVEVIEEAAASAHAPVFQLSKDFMPKDIIPGSIQTFDYQGIGVMYKSVRIGMLGRYQIDNACLALAAVECLRNSGIAVDEAAVYRGMERAVWEGRLERVAEKPDIYLDGAHNPAAARLLARAIKEMKTGYGRLILVIGILADKDYRGILSELVPLADHVVITRPQYSRAMDISTLASEVMRLHGSVDASGTVSEAVAAARKIVSKDDLILIAGSLYVVGEARAALVQDAVRSHALSGLKG